MRSIAWYLLVILISMSNSTNCQAGADFKRFNHVGVGYSANIPKEILGLCFFSARANGIGAYLDFKMTFPMIYSREDYYENISDHTAESWDDGELQNKTDWISVNVGVTRSMWSPLLVYIGIGYSNASSYRRYYDEFQILGDDGKYWIEVESKNRMNTIAGFLLSLSPKWGLQVGYEAQPAGFTFGLFGII